MYDPHQLFHSVADFRISTTQVAGRFRRTSSPPTIVCTPRGSNSVQRPQYSPVSSTSSCYSRSFLPTPTPTPESGIHLDPFRDVDAWSSISSCPSYSPPCSPPSTVSTTASDLLSRTSSISSTARRPCRGGANRILPGASIGDCYPERTKLKGIISGLRSSSCQTIGKSAVASSTSNDIPVAGGACGDAGKVIDGNGATELMKHNSEKNFDGNSRKTSDETLYEKTSGRLLQSLDVLKIGGRSVLHHSRSNDDFADISGHDVEEDEQELYRKSDSINDDHSCHELKNAEFSADDSVTRLNTSTGFISSSLGKNEQNKSFEKVAVSCDNGVNTLESTTGTSTFISLINERPGKPQRTHDINPQRITTNTITARGIINDESPHMEETPGHTTYTSVQPTQQPRMRELFCSTLNSTSTSSESGSHGKDRSNLMTRFSPRRRRKPQGVKGGEESLSRGSLGASPPSIETSSAIQDSIDSMDQT